MSEAAPSFQFRLPPETAEVKKEQIKLGATALNAIAIAFLIAAIAGPVITTLSDEDLSASARALLALAGTVLHLAGRTYLRYISEQRSV